MSAKSFVNDPSASLHIYTFYSEKRRVHTGTNCTIPLAEIKEC